MVFWPPSKLQPRGATQRAPPRTEESTQQVGFAALARESVRHAPSAAVEAIRRPLPGTAGQHLISASALGYLG
eukprot:5891269-Prymnesium_polylepis.1